MSDVLWKLDGVFLGGGSTPRLAEVSLEIRAGVTAVLGCSGAGKTSLLNLLVGYETPALGTLAATLPQPDRSLAVFWAPQNAGLWPQLTVLEHLEQVMPEQDTERAMALLASLDIAARASARPDELSQGERSRVAVARALTAGAAVLVMDEPFASVDVARIGRYWAVVREHVASSGCSLVFATHSPEAVLAEAERVICLKEGRVLYEGDVQELYWRPRTREQADCLGESNWLTPQECRLWLGRQESAPRSYRPEQIAVARADEGPLLVESSCFKGAVAEVELLHEQTGQRRRFFHRPAADHLLRGTRVLLRALVALLLAFLAGCGGSDEPALAFRRVRSWPIPPDGTRLPAPRVVAIGRSDQFIVLDAAGRVLVFDENGKLLRQWRMPDSKAGRPEGACVLKDGHIAVADTHYHQVVVFDATGQVAKTFGSHGDGSGQFRYPVAVAQDDTQNLYVCEYGGNDRVQKFSVDGKFLLAFGSFGEGPHQFQRPSGMVWHDGKVYVADAMNNRIQVFTDAGTFLGTLAGADGAFSLHYPYDIALGPAAFLYVIEYGGGRVTMLSLSGVLAGRFGSTGRGAGQFLTPWGIAVDSQGRIRVADAGNRRIVGLEP